MLEEMSAATKYNVTGKYKYKTVADAVNALSTLVNLTGWSTISITTPSATVTQISIKRTFSAIADARAWITSVSKEDAFDGVEVTQT